MYFLKLIQFFYLDTKTKSAYYIWSKDLVYKGALGLSSRIPFGYFLTSYSVNLSTLF